MLRDELLEQIARIPVIDVHTHLDRNALAADDLWTVLGYHMVRYPLRSAGVSEEKLWPGGNFHQIDDAMRQEFLGAWPHVKNTGFGWALRQILADLYEFDEELTAESMPALVETFRARRSDPDWGREILRRAGIVRVMSSRLDERSFVLGDDDPHMRLTVESQPTVGTREYLPWTDRLERLDRRAGREVKTVTDLFDASVAHYEMFDWSDKRALVSWTSSVADFTPTGDAEIADTLQRLRAGQPVSPEKLERLEAACIRAMLHAVGDKVDVFQWVFGVQFLTSGRPHPVAKASEAFFQTMGHLVGEFADLQFDMLSGYELAEPLLCGLALGYANVSLTSFWWQTFYPSVMLAALRRRLDMVPAAKLCGFFSDGWCTEWTYARLKMTRHVLADVLAERVEQGLASMDDAVATARQMLFDTPKRLFLAEESIGLPAEAGR